MEDGECHVTFLGRRLLERLTQCANLKISLRGFFTTEAMENESQATADQYNRMAGYEDVKGKVRQEVNEEIAGQAGRLDEHERVQAAAVCGRLKPNAAREVIDTEAELERAR